MKYIIKFVFFILPFVIIIGAMWLLDNRGLNNLFTVIGAGTLVYLSLKGLSKIYERYFPEDVKTERMRQQMVETYNRHTTL